MGDASGLHQFHALSSEIQTHSEGVTWYGCIHSFWHICKTTCRLRCLAKSTVSHNFSGKKRPKLELA